MPNTLHLLRYVHFNGTLTVLSGLRIGAPKDDIEIGGTDAPVLRHPLTQVPYVPGSSLKGKLRSLLEYRYRYDQISGRGEPCGCARPDCLVCIIFGPHKKTNHGLGPTRLLARDATMTSESVELLSGVGMQERGLLFTEVKTENSIDRRVGVALAPRSQERVPKDASFDFRLSLRVFDGDDQARHIAFIEEGLKLVQADYLGGSGSRGYGEVRLEWQHD